MMTKKKDEAVSAQLNFVDSEGHNVTFEIQDVSGVTVNSSGFFEWSSDHNVNLVVQVTLTDQCGAQQTQELALKVKGTT